MPKPEAPHGIVCATSTVTDRDDRYSPTADVLIVGGSIGRSAGGGGLTAARSGTRVTVVSNEAHLPYELPPLSKIALDDGPGSRSLDLSVRGRSGQLGGSISGWAPSDSLDTSTRTSSSLACEDEFGTARWSSRPAATVRPAAVRRARPNVFTLRRFEDAVALRRRVADPSRSVAVVGAGFIGGEFASTLVKARPEVSLIDLGAPAARPGCGASIADAVHRLHRDAGVNLPSGVAVVEIAEDDGGRVLVLDDGRRVPADVILVGVGVRPSTDWLRAPNSPTTTGLCATRPCAPLTECSSPGTRPLAERPLRCRDAGRALDQRREQGRAAGSNAATVLRADRAACHSSVVPYFWSDQHGARIQFAASSAATRRSSRQVTADGSLFCIAPATR